MDLKWIRASSHAIKTADDQFHIAKTGVQKPMYCLWQYRVLVKCFSSADKAKRTAEELAR